MLTTPRQLHDTQESTTHIDLLQKPKAKGTKKMYIYLSYI